MNVYIKNILPVVIVFAFSPLFGMELKRLKIEKEGSKEELMPADHPLLVSSEPNCFIDDITINSSSNFPPDVSTIINKMCGDEGPLTNHANAWLGYSTGPDTRYAKVSSKGERVGILFNDHSFKLIDLEGEAVLMKEDEVDFFELSSDGKMILIKKKDHYKVIDLNNKKELINQTLEEQRSFHCDGFSADGKLFWTETKDETYRLFDLENNGNELLSGRLRGVRCIECIPDSDLICILFKDHVLKLINKNNINDGWLLEEPNVHSFECSRDGKLIAYSTTNNSDNTKVISIEDKRVIIDIPGCEDIRFSLDSQLIAVPDDCENLKIFAIDGTELFNRASVRNYEFSPDSTKVAILFNDDKFQLVDVKTKENLSEVDEDVCDYQFSFDSTMICIRFYSGDLSLFDIANGQERLYIGKDEDKHGDDDADEDDLAKFGFSYDNKWLWAIFGADALRVVDIATGEDRLQDSGVSLVKFIPDSTMIVLYYYRKPDMDTVNFKIIDVVSKKTLVEKHGVDCSYRIAPDGSKIWITFDKQKGTEFIYTKPRNFTVCQALYLQELYEYMTGKKKISEEEGAKLYHTEHGLAVFRTLPENIQQRLITLRNGRVESSKN